METFAREYHLLIRNTTVILAFIVGFVVLSGFIRFSLGILKRKKNSSNEDSFSGNKI